MSTLPSFDKHSLCAAVASGDIQAAARLLREGSAKVDERSPEGFAPLCIAAFWGYADIVKLLLEHGADVNITNKGTGWTPCHCAAFQGHGKALLYLTQHKPDLSIRDSVGRTSSDFGSALNTIWPFFAAQGCKRTSKADLIRLDIVKKVTPVEPVDSTTSGGNGGGGGGGGSLQKMSEMTAHFSRPGSAYVVQAQPVRPGINNSQSSATALAYGDVLRDDGAAGLEQATGQKQRLGGKAFREEEDKVQLNAWRT